MFLFDYRATERGIHQRGVQMISEQQKVYRGPYNRRPAPLPVPPVETADEAERRRIEEIESQRNNGLRLFRQKGMPYWALAILTAVADRHAICPSDIGSRKRNRPIIEARREAVYLIKAKKPALSSVLLGKWFAKDHTSICHLIACYQTEHNAPKLVGYDLARVRARNCDAARKARREAKE